MAHSKAFSVQLGDGGRLVLPAKIRKQLNLVDGDELLITIEPDGSLRVTTPRHVAKQTRGLYPVQARQPSLTDELIAERRAEVTKEMVKQRRVKPSA